MDYLYVLAIIIGIYVILAASFNLIIGYGGMISIAHPAFFAIGAYASALLARDLGWPVILAALAAAAIAFVASLLVSLPALRVSGDYLMIASLGFQLGLIELIKNVSFTGGSGGLSGIPSLLGGALGGGGYAAVVVLSAILVLLLIRYVMRSDYGRAIAVLRDDEQAFATLGRDPMWIKIWVIALGSGIAGYAGALYAHYFRFLTADQFDVLQSAAMTIAAIGIALSQASGVFEFLSNGSSVKSLHPGWAAHAGLTAAALADAGMTGPETAIEGRYGLFASFTGADLAARFEAQIDSLGAIWHLPDAAFKFYPCCHYLHPFIEAAQALAHRGIIPDQIGHLTLRLAPGAAAIVCDPWPAKLDPPTPHAARWSLPIVVAAQLIEGSIGLATFEHPLSPPVRALAARSAWEPLPGADFPRRFEAEIACDRHDGARDTVRIPDVRGNASRPAAPAEIETKFAANAARILTPGAVVAAQAAIAADNLPALTRALRDARTP